MFSTVAVMPSDAWGPFNMDNCPLFAAVMELGDDNGAAALDRVSGNREESNVDVPDDDVPAGGSQDGGGPGSGQTTLEQQAFMAFPKCNTKVWIVPKSSLD